MIATLSIQKAASFYLPWLAAAAVAAKLPPEAEGSLVIVIDGMELPVMQMVLAAAGVLLSRPLAPRRVPPLGWGRQALVTAIMLLIALTWAAESRPGMLFTFVVSIGLGFSGYALIEIAGQEIEAFVRRVFARATDMLNRIGKDK
jgi:hypothetical protein